MTPQQSLRFLRLGAFALMIPVAVQLVSYTHRSFSRAWLFCFGEPGRWNTHRWVDPDTVIETGPRVAYFALWGSVIVASMAAFVVGLYLLFRVSKGLIFDDRTALTLRVLGLVMVFALAYDQVFAAIVPSMLTRFNAEGPLPIRWAYDPTDFKMILLGMILYLCGWVMHKGVEVARENQRYV